MSANTVGIHVFGSLRRYLDEQGLPYEIKMEVSNQGSRARTLAVELCIPLAQVEAVFCNGRVIDINDPVFGGDRVAFFPYGTPGPYRLLLGIAGRRHGPGVRAENGGQ